MPGESKEDNPTAQKQPAQAVVGSQNDVLPTTFDANRYLVLIFGIILIVFLLSDMRKTIAGGLSRHDDKKTNNLLLLAIAVIVIAFLYWF